MPSVPAPVNGHRVRSAIAWQVSGFILSLSEPAAAAVALHSQWDMLRRCGGVAQAVWQCYKGPVQLERE